MESKIANQLALLGNIQNAVESGRYKFKGGKQAFDKWLVRFSVNNLKGAVEDLNSQDLFNSNIELLIEADRNMVEVKIPVAANRKEAAEEEEFEVSKPWWKFW